MKRKLRPDFRARIERQWMREYESVLALIYDARTEVIPSWLMLSFEDARDAGLQLLPPGPGVTVLDDGTVLVEAEGDAVRPERRK